MESLTTPDGVLVLIAEDEPSIAAVVAIVQDMGYTPLEARNGLQAVTFYIRRWRRSGRSTPFHDKIGKTVLLSGDEPAERDSA